MTAAANPAYPDPARLFRTIAERAAPWWRVYRDAAGTDPEIAHDWTTLTALRRTTTAELLLQDLAGTARGRLPERLIDTVWVVASPETCDLLVRQSGYTLNELSSGSATPCSPSSR